MKGVDTTTEAMREESTTAIGEVGAVLAGDEGEGGSLVGEENVLVAGEVEDAKAPVDEVVMREKGATV